MLYKPQEGFKEQNRKSEPLGHMDLNEFDPVLNGAPSPANSDLMYEYYDQPSAVMPELPWEPEETTDSEVGGHKAKPSALMVSCSFSYT